MNVAYKHEENTYQGFCLDPQFADTFFPHIKHYLAAARAATGYSFNEQAMLADLKSKDMLLWLVLRNDVDICGAVATQLFKGNDEELVCLIFCLGGEGMKHWLHLIEIIEEYAKDEGCARVRVEGRTGWQRALSPEYHPVGVILERRI